jgi:transglutaminase-like putative cysteine protease
MIVVVLMAGRAGDSYGQPLPQTLWPEAVDAIVVLDESEFHVFDANRAKSTRHRITLVYNERGKKYGEVIISEHAFITCKSKTITGRILDVNGNVIWELKKDDIHQIDLSAGYVFYSDSKARRFELKHNSFPYQVEYSYEVDYASLLFWPPWYPQEEIPVVKSTYTLVLDEQVGYRAHSIGIQTAPRVTREKERSVLRWELENIKPKVEESRMPPEHTTQMAMLFAPTDFAVETYRGSCASWDGFAAWYRNLTSGRYALSQEAKVEVAQRFAVTDSPRRRVEKLYTFLQDVTRYVAIELGIGGWRPQSAHSVFLNQYGDCKDLVTFMVAMLKEAGITAYPALTLTRNRGVLMKEFPSQQFNHCIAFVPLQDDTLWLECTRDFLTAGELPADVEGCDVLVVKETGGEIIRTPQSGSDENRWTSTVEGTLTSTGALRFTGRVTATGNVGDGLRVGLSSLKPDEREQGIGRLLGQYVPKLDVHEYEIDHLTDTYERPLVIRFSGTVHGFGLRSAERIFFNPNLLNRQTADDVPSEKERRFPLYLGDASMAGDSLVLSVPTGFEIEAAPDSLKIKEPFGSYRTAYSFTDETLIYSRTFSYDHHQIPQAMYQDYLAFLKAVVKNDQARFVLKKVQG